MTEPTSRPDWSESFDPVAMTGEIQRRIGVRAIRQAPLARLTTMRVGGPADLYAIANNVFELRALVRFARTRGIPYFILGRGSNLVISDAGMRGLVIHSRAQGYEIHADRLRAESGLPLAKAATETQRAGLSGLEFGLAIPGCVGGAVWANAGAHEGEIAGVLESAVILEADGIERQRGASEMGFGYRDSRLKHTPGDSPQDVVLSATFQLHPDDPTTIRARLDEIRRWRQAHQPVGSPSAGSIFRNPAAGDSAGALIDQAGLKGTNQGGAFVSDRHANWIINRGGATAAEVRSLAERLREAVRQRSGVELVYEVGFVGDWRGWSEEQR